jgi:hypothetical protein
MDLAIGVGVIVICLVYNAKMSIQSFKVRARPVHRVTNGKACPSSNMLLQQAKFRTDIEKFVVPLGGLRLLRSIVSDAIMSSYVVRRHQRTRICDAPCIA